MQLKSEVLADVAASPSSQRVPGDASSPEPVGKLNGGVRFSREGGVAQTFCDGASQLRVMAMHGITQNPVFNAPKMPICGL